MTTIEGFCFREAFSRTIGWVHEEELALLRRKRVALAGLGGVGGSHLLTLSRLGIGAFTLADPDRFELVNMNRQAGAFISTLGEPKVEVLARMVRGINPEVDLRTFQDGVQPQCVHEFLKDADLYLDGLDFFTLAIRRQIFAACSELGIPAVTAAPLGMGAAVLSFLPGKTTFEDYFRLEGQPPEEQLLRFLLGLAPAGLHRSSLVDPSALNLEAQQGPSTPMGCELCAGTAATEVLKLLLGRGPVRAAPHGMQFDAYRNRIARTWRPGGNHHPLQRLGLRIARRHLLDSSSQPPVHSIAPEQAKPLDQILDLARWSPSGDNTQPWCFELDPPDMVTVRVQPPDQCDPYDFDHRGTWLAIGSLLESLRLAATRFGRSLNWELSEDLRSIPRITVSLSPDRGITEDPLTLHLPRRSVRRGPYRIKRLSEEHKERLQGVLPSSVEIQWRERWTECWRWARINARATQIRLSIPETFEIHRRVLDWRRQYSPSGVPAATIPVDPLTRRLMAWALRDWARVCFLNRYLAGTVLPRLEMDWLPGLACGAHFQLHADLPDEPSDRHRRLLDIGMGLQRFWLTADRFGLVLQPSFAPLAFAYYARNNLPFTRHTSGQNQAKRLAEDLAKIVHPQHPETLVFAGRIGVPWQPMPSARSVRRPLSEMVCNSPAGE